MSEPQGIHSVDRVVLGDRIPHDERLAILRFWIGAKESYHTRNHQGTSYTSSSRGWDFGVDVENRSDVEMKLVLILRTVAADGFSTSTRTMIVEAAPGEQARRWANLTIHKKSEFTRIVIADICISPTSEKVSVMRTKPEQSIHQMLNLQSVRFPRRIRDISFWGCYGIVLLILLAFSVIGFLGL